MLALFEFNNMAQNKKQVAPKQPEHSRSNQRESDSFVYNSDIQRHIGKRTGNYYGRVNPKQNFDGFPRFSEYESHRNTESSSLAKQLEVTDNISSHPAHDSHELDPAPFDQPFEAKESPITAVITLQQATRHSSSRIHAAPLPGFGFGVGHQNYEISTIKRRNSTVRPSELKTYRDLLVDLEADEFKQFIFNDDQIEYIASSAQKQKQQAHQQQARENKKKKKQARVSFKQKPIEHSMSSGSKKQSSIKMQPHNQQASQNCVKEEDDENVKKQIVQSKPRVEYETDYFVKKQSEEQSPHRSNNSNQVVNSYADHQNNRQVNHKESKPDDEVEKSSKRKSKKEVRLVDSPDTDSNLGRGEIEKQVKKQSKKAVKQIKVKKTSKQNLQSRTTKVRPKSQQNQYIEQLTSSPTENQSNERYPRRIRIKPVQYWENERVHYKNGKAMSIQRASMNLRQILKINENFEHKININFYSKDVEIEVVIPPLKVLESQGFKQPYELLQVELLGKQNTQGVYFEDGLRSIQMQLNEVVEVERHKYFQISNKQRLPTKIQLRLKVG